MIILSETALKEFRVSGGDPTGDGTEGDRSCMGDWGRRAGDTTLRFAEKSLNDRATKILNQR